MTARSVAGELVVGVIGAGAMGTGIAQVALAHGHRVLLSDADAPALARSRELLKKSLAREVEKGRLDEVAADGALNSLQPVDPASGLVAFSECGIVIEAIVERLDVKQATFRALEEVLKDEAILATNTSSLSIAAIAAASVHPGRVIGMHFFNPAPVLPLVEIIPGIRTDARITDAAKAIADSWGKTTVIASDTPGFIVNRIARPFYGEALRMLEEGVADISTIDWALRTIGGFRMGPFELMDFIGHDVNYLVTESVWAAMYFDGRYRPSLAQKRLLEAGLLGRKSGRGFYDHAADAVAPQPMEDRDLGAMIVERVVAMLINEAVDAVSRRVASPDDIETAMTRGVSYPKGLLAWGDEIGYERVLTTLDALQSEYREERYRASPLLRRMARDQTRFFSTERR
jgi:3-hydroxybutyryl-CoA dehydrogenase